MSYVIDINSYFGDKKYLAQTLKVAGDLHRASGAFEDPDGSWGFPRSWYVKDWVERLTNLCFLRATVCKYRESGVSREIFNFFIFCPNNLYSELFSKILFEGPEAL